MPKNFEIYSDECQRILGTSPELKLLSSDLKFAEGGCWVEYSGFLIVSDFLNDRIVKWSESDGLGIFRQTVSTANANTVDLEGRVVSCHTRDRSIVRGARRMLDHDSGPLWKRPPDLSSS
jgi:gluconolactonase